MQKLRYKPKFDGLFFMIMLPTLILTLACAVVPAIFELKTLFYTLPINLFVAYFFISPLFAYVELREKTLFIKYGFILKREIPYGKIRKIERERKWYSDSILSLKNSFEHVNIRYNSFDVTSISLKDNDGFILKLEEQCRR